MTQKSDADKISAALQEMVRTVDAAFSNLSNNPFDVRRAYMQALGAATEFSRQVSARSEIQSHISQLLFMLADLERGVVHPILRPTGTNGRPRDSTFVWQARADVALGMHFLIASGMTMQKAAEKIATDYPGCDRLLRTLLKGQTLEGAIGWWYKQFKSGKVAARDSAAQAGYDEYLRQIQQFGLEVWQFADEADHQLRRAVEQAAAIPEDAIPAAEDEPDWFKDEMNS